MFIVFEGSDGAGKTTQIKKLHDYLRQKKIDVLQTKEPGGVGQCEILREMLLDKKYEWEAVSELFLFLADRFEHWTKLIQPALSKGKVVLCDRFKLSTIAYQGYGKKVPVEQIKALHDMFLKDANPDLTFVLDIPTQVSVCRISKNPDRMEMNDLSFKERVQEGFVELSKQTENAHLIDATQPPEQIHQQIVQKLMPLL